MNSDAKNSDLVEVLTSLKKFEEFLYLRNKKVLHIKEKRKIFYLFITFSFTPNQQEQKSNWKYYPQFKESDITFGVNCISYIFVKINTN